MKKVFQVTMFKRIIVFFLAITGCPKMDPTVTDGGADGGSVAGQFCQSVPMFTENVSSCPKGADDYRPRESNSSLDTWPACISDNNVFTPSNPSIGSVARTQAYESIANRLWRNRIIPVPNDFVEAKVAYAVDQGIDSRIQRREDVHYTAAPMPCSTAGIPADFPERCVGPATLLPILNDAFEKGAMGETPLVHGARIEAAFDWFFYVSALSEVMSCTDKVADCDSCWAYYAGGTARDMPLGIAKEFFRFAPETHQRAYDATLAVRCWRDLDKVTPATNLMRRDLARAQLDKALLRGMALLLREKIVELPCSTGQVLDARWAYVKIVGPLLDRAARERNQMQADKLQSEFSKASPGEVDTVGVLMAIDSLFQCP
jgi:hypothetical protein